MRKITGKLHLNRETLRQLIDGPDLRHVAAGASFPVTVCGGTCPPVCTVNRVCAG